jgi:two-component system sensor histidine kinase QseC
MPIVLALPPPLEAARHDEPSPLGHYYETKIAFQVRDAGGRVLARSASAPEAPLASLDAGFRTQAIGEHAWRVFSLRSGDAWVQVAERDDVRDELAGKIALAAVTPFLVGIPLLLVLLSLLIRYGLAPLAALVHEISARQPGSTEQVSLARAPAEMQPLVGALNGLLERVRRALERERRFTADAAHELRTPLAALKVHAQNAARAGSAEEREASLQRMLSGLERTIRLAEQMLAYSRAAALEDGARAEEVPLQPLLQEALDTVQPLADERGIALALSADPASLASVTGERQKLRSLMTNLVDNAVRYRPRGAQVDVDLRGASFRVTDQGPGIPPELRDRVFESYFRVPGSGSTGSGLGLAIAREVAQAHRATVELSSGPEGRGTCVTVRFPSRP